jgi:hypothetical protein
MVSSVEELFRGTPGLTRLVFVGGTGIFCNIMSASGVSSIEGK